MKRYVLALCALALVFCAHPTSVQAKPIHCVGCDFGHADLHGRDFSGVDYVGADFSGANLQSANFRDAKLVGADFRDADLRGADFTGANCTGCAFHRSKLSGAHFAGVKLTGADLQDTLDGLNDTELRAILNTCTGCDLRRANLSGHDLSGITMIGTALQDASANRASFENARLIGVDFSHANLRDANFRGAAVCWYNHSVENNEVRSRETECLDVRGADVRGADFTGARICDSINDRWSCSPVSAATLRNYARGSLQGATLPSP